MRVYLTLFTLLIGLSGAKPLAIPQGVAIGNQVWMDKNLGVTAFRNGDPLKYCWNAEEWMSAIKKEIPAYTYYNFDPKNGVKHGCIYNQYAIRDRRALAPEGWTIPKLKDIKKLQEQEPQLAYVLRSQGNQSDGNGLWAHKQRLFSELQNRDGFNALPSGELMALPGNGSVQFLGMGTVATWWTGSAGYRANDLQNTWKLRQNFASMELQMGITSPRYAGHYVRCLKKRN